MKSASGIFGVLTLVVASAVVAGCSNKAPRLAPLENRSVVANQTLEFDVIASDPDGNDLAFAVSGKPRTALFEPLGRSAHFSWTPLISDVRPEPYRVTFTVRDGKGGTDSQTLVITVIESSVPGEGSPAFLGPYNFALDLAATESITFKVSVKDDNSSDVTLRAISNVEGATFDQDEPKAATFSWRPTADQIAARSVWVLTVGAKDDSHDEVVQDYTILVRRKPNQNPACTGTPPTITHTALGDQRDAGDYQVVANVTDSESSVARVDLYFAVVDAGEEPPEQFGSKQMSAGTGGSFTAAIPNPNLSGSETRTIYYYIVAEDDDDANGTDCDRQATFPATAGSRLSFVAYAPGSSQCQDDAEANNTRGTAMVLATDTLSGRRLCPGQEDWYSISLTAGQGLFVIVSHESANGNIDAELYAPTGSSPIASARTSSDLESLEIQPVAQSGTYYLRVFGAATTVQNSYEINIERRTSCAPDAFEPNDSSSAARVVTLPFSQQNLTRCKQDNDYFAFDVPAGHDLKIEITFTHADADLGIELRNSLGQYAGQSDGNAGTEKIEKSCVAGGRYKLRVFSSEADKQARYNIVVSSQASSTACCDKGFEPNNDATKATTLTANQTVSGLAICAGDTDYFKVHLNAGERLDAQLAFTHTAGDLRATLIAPGGTTTIDVSDYSAPGVNEERAFTVACSAGDYLVKIDAPDGGTQAAYSITPIVSATSAPSCMDGSNSTPATAAVITPGAYRDVLCPGRWDYWRVNGLAAGKTIRVDIAFEEACGNLDLRLYGPAGNSPPGTTRATSEATSGNTESAQYTIPSGGSGDYVLGVKWGSGTWTAASAYNFTITVTP